MLSTFFRDKSYSFLIGSYWYFPSKHLLNNVLPVKVSQSGCVHLGSQNHRLSHTTVFNKFSLESLPWKSLSKPLPNNLLPLMSTTQGDMSLVFNHISKNHFLVLQTIKANKTSILMLCFFSNYWKRDCTYCAPLKGKPLGSKNDPEPDWTWTWRTPPCHGWWLPVLHVTQQNRFSSSTCHMHACPMQ